MNIVLSTGASGGHIFPAVALAEALARDPRQEVLFLFTARDLQLIRPPAQKFYTIVMSAPRFRKPLYTLGWCVALAKAFFQCRKVLRETRASLLVAFGNYSSLPAVLAAHSLKVPVFLHEQNVYPGLANRMLAPFAKKIGVSFEETKKYFKAGKTIKVGNPLRGMVAEGKKQAAYAYFGLSQEKITLLALGGSQGASFINGFLPRALKSIPHLHSRVQVLHLRGRHGTRALTAEYEAMGISHKVVDFLDDMAQAYSIADIAITRAGATTLRELSAYGIASIFIPYPAKNVHQYDNARYYTARHAGVLYCEHHAPDIFTKLLECLITGKEVRSRMGVSFKKLHYQTTDDFVRAVKEAAR
jgi:UDP-N-acetylglucosamine--N-acetylmuramyl-(pentapeptide) pyrophosphoryl-undecaprenol N-acetylglucosamine transferase